MRRSVIDCSRGVCSSIGFGLALLACSNTFAAQQSQSPPPSAAAPPPATPVEPTLTIPSQPLSPKRPPFPNRANDVMPSWLRVRAELRERVEGVDNAGFVDGRDDLYYLSRFRFTATATAKHAAATIQLQDARVGDKSIGSTGSPFSASFDVRQAYADLGGPTSRIIARLGRQEIAFGDQRLVGHANWLNAGRSFDAARVTVKTKPAQIDLFASSVVRTLPGELDTSGHGNRFAGVYVASGRVLPQGTAEPYVFWRRDTNQSAESGALDALDQITTGARLVGKLPGRLDYNIEMVLQRGSLATDSIQAWAGHWQLRETLTGPWTPHLTGEYNFASGDSDPTDGIRQTFDQLYPTAHDKYGLADQVGWRNIHQIRAGVDVTPIKATPISFNYHSYWIAEPRDALYAASGAALARVPAGAASRRVGQEVDIQVARPLTPQLLLAAGYSHLFTGPFLKEATPGKSYSGPFLMVTYVFLAEK